jgi:acyl-coenzyme A thioesterase PaaI-like protein
LSPALTNDQLAKVLERRSAGLPGRHTLVALTPDSAVISLEVEDANLRMSGALSGPTLMTLVDLVGGMLVAALGGQESGRQFELGEVVTTNLTIHFLRPSQSRLAHGEARVIKQGNRSVVEVSLTDGDPGMVATALVEFSRRP